MQMSRRGSGPVAPASHACHGPIHGARSERHRKIRPLVPFLLASLFTASICISTANAANFGHSRIVSAPGQPLLLEIPVTDLTQQEIDSIRATPAPAEAWRAAGMTPPVPLDSMRLVLLDGFRPDAKLIQLRSPLAAQQSVVDVLIDVRSVSGQQRYQVSLIAHADSRAIQRAVSSSGGTGRVIDNKGALPDRTDSSVAGRQIIVRPGDNMFAVASRNAVQGVTVYQMMIALQRSNPQAFIHDNVNLVRAGSTLTMPDMEVLTALSDREARRIFMQHVQAFARYGQRAGSADVVAASTVAAAAEGAVQEETRALPESSSASADTQGSDILRLSGTRVPGASPTAGISGATGSGRTAAAGSTLANGAEPNASAVGPAPVSLLASNGHIASDAVLHQGPHALSSDQGTRVPFGSEASSGGTVVSADGALIDPDDAAAQQKGIEASKKRIVELEDNVRHLNEALQKQGHVAAEAALEGARSVTEVLKEVINLVDPDAAVNGAGTETGSAADAPGSATESVGPGTSANGRVSGSASDASGSASGAGAPGAADKQGSAQTGDSSAGASGSEARTATQSGATSSQSTGSGASAGAAPSSSATTASRQGGAGVSPGQADTSGPAPMASQAGGKSWWEKNMLWAIGGGIALLVLLVVWLLRRASSAREDTFETDSPISDSMLQEKLREIDLDLNNPPDGGRRRS